jgi:hypothetical protein
MTTKVTAEEFGAYVDKVSEELYSPEEWEAQRLIEEQTKLPPLELNGMREHVFSTCFERRPDLFEGIQWINSEYGLPLWVREGVEWRLEDEDEDDDYYIE